MIDLRRLLADLGSYGGDYPGEQGTISRFSDLLSRAADPFAREFPDHITASAVVARPDGSAFLLVYHRRLERWLQPGGHVEPEDSSTLAAALREAREETGIIDPMLPRGDRILDLDVHPIPASRGRLAHVHYDLRYLAATRGEPQAFAADEIREVRWFAREEALVSWADESLARALRKAATFLAQRSGPTHRIE